jgi:hypothetical protein
MKRFAALGFIMLICLMSSACSYSVDFIVVNESDTEIELEYTLSKEHYNPASETPTLHEYLVPARMDLSIWQTRFKREDWRNVAENEYLFDSKTGKCKVKIAPKQALRIVKTSDYLFFGDNYKDFQIAELEIKGENGRVVLESLQLFKQFSGKNYSNRFIAYK